MSQPAVSAKTYLLTYVALLVLTLSTTLIGYIDLGWGSMFIAVTIATIKASLIALFFMHALVEKKLVWLVIAGALMWFLILVTLTMGDYITRGWISAAGS